MSDDVQAANHRAVMDAIATLRAETNRGIDGMHQRQDKTNGQVTALQVQAARHDERIEFLENIEQVRHSATSQAMRAASLQSDRVSDDIKPITRREVALVTASTTGAVAATLAFLKFLRLLP